MDEKLVADGFASSWWETMIKGCTVPHVESKRSLPAWMLKSCSGNDVAKTEGRNKQALESDVQIGSLDQTNPVKRKTGRRSKNVDSEGSGEHLVLQPCGGRERARRKSKDAVRKEFEEVEKVTTNNPRKASARAAPKNSRKRKLENVKSGSPSPGTSDDEIELTVEDLVSIAQEYVNTDKQKQGLEMMKTARSEERPTCPAISTDADMGEKVADARSMTGLFQCTTVTTNTRPSDHQGDERRSHQQLQCSSSVESTGDVVQEMLSLFLGPLWSKLAGYGNKSEYTEATTETANHLPCYGNKSEYIESLTAANHLPGYGKKCEYTESINLAANHSPEKKDMHSQVRQREPDMHSQVPRQGGPLAKKKSSLKDKVSLLFD
ncbi:hypothetical protein ACP70R_019108 [Stipagrostis hirtigluma subsp. patula]